MTYIIKHVGKTIYLAFTEMWKRGELMGLIDIRFSSQCPLPAAQLTMPMLRLELDYPAHI